VDFCRISAGVLEELVGVGASGMGGAGGPGGRLESASHEKCPQPPSAVSIVTTGYVLLCIVIFTFSFPFYDVYTRGILFFGLPQCHIQIFFLDQMLRAVLMSFSA